MVCIDSDASGMMFDTKDTPGLKGGNKAYSFAQSIEQRKYSTKTQSVKVMYGKTRPEFKRNRETTGQTGRFTGALLETALFYRSLSRAVPSASTLPAVRCMVPSKTSSVTSFATNSLNGVLASCANSLLCSLSSPQFSP